MSAWKFYSDHLERVSRSFSFCIAQLRSPQREWIALSYLLFRIADTIEDSTWPSQKEQFKQFESFELALHSKSQANTLTGWPDCFPSKIPSSEKLLLEDAKTLLDNLYALPVKQRQQIQKNVCQMMAGMRYFLKNHSKQGELVLSNFCQLNQYCFFVAGLVGELLTVFFTEGLTALDVNDELLLDGFHFGLFLQKINILKDQASDETIGRKFVSSRDKLRQSINMHAKHAIEYIKRLPTNEGKTFRLFCAWSLFIGLASLKWIDKSYQSGKTYKIPYSETMSLVIKLKYIISDPLALDKLFFNYIPKDNDSNNIENTNKNELPDWFYKIYPSTLVRSHAAELGLIE